MQEIVPPKIKCPARLHTNQKSGAPPNTSSRKRSCSATNAKSQSHGFEPYAQGLRYSSMPVPCMNPMDVPLGYKRCETICNYQDEAMKFTICIYVYIYIRIYIYYTYILYYIYILSTYSFIWCQICIYLRVPSTLKPPSRRVSGRLKLPVTVFLCAQKNVRDPNESGG